jgi:hypothetical protein
MIQTSVIKNFEEIEDIKQYWNNIVKEEKLDVSASYIWSTIIWESHLNKTDLNVIVVKKNDEILGIFPIFLNKKTIKGFPVKTVNLLANLNCLHHELIMRKNPNEILSTFFDTLNNTVDFRNWHIIEILWVAEEGATNFFLKSYLPMHKYPYRILPGIISPYIKIDHLSWAEYLKSLKKKDRDNFIRKKNKIQRGGDTEIKQLVNYAEIIDTIRRIEEKSWKHQNRSAIIDKDRQIKFYDLLIKKYNSNLLFFVLYFNKKPISYSMGLLYDNKYYSLKTSYDMEYRNFSPGIVLRFYLLEYCFNLNFHEFDFCGVDEPWKKGFTKASRQHINYIIFNKKIYPKSLYLVSKLCRSKN